MIMSTSAEELKTFIRRHIASKTPGLFEILNSFSMKRYGVKILDLFFTSPEKLVELLMNYYRDSYTAKFTLQYLFIRPLLVKIKKLDLEEKVVEMLLNDPKEFKKLLENLNIV